MLAIHLLITCGMYHGYTDANSHHEELATFNGSYSGMPLMYVSLTGPNIQYIIRTENGAFADILNRTITLLAND